MYSLQSQISDVWVVLSKQFQTFVAYYSLCVEFDYFKMIYMYFYNKKSMLTMFQKNIYITKSSSQSCVLKTMLMSKTSLICDWREHMKKLLLCLMS